LLAKAGERFVGEQAARERIAAVDDQVLFKSEGATLARRAVRDA
jgi:hypothetical protein